MGKNIKRGIQLKIFILVPEINENHTALAHLPTWIRKIAEKVDKVYVFTLKFQKNTVFPENVNVYCPQRKNKLYYFFNINYLLMINTIRSDVFFCLMYPILTFWASYYARLFQKPIVTWYAHASISEKLKKAHDLSDIVVTSSKDGCRLKSNKIRIIGQAIDTKKFTEKRNKPLKHTKILYLGRISPVKGLENLIDAANILINENSINTLKFEIVGDILTESDEEYYNNLIKQINEYHLRDYFIFHGSIHYSKVVEFYQNCDIFVNPSYAGSLEKTVLEAMACGKIVITSNEAYYNIFDEEIREKCYFKQGDYNELAEKIMSNIFSPSELVRSKLNNIVINDHSLDAWSDKLINIFKELSNH